jgi:hypothetical protein
MHFILVAAMLCSPAEAQYYRNSGSRNTSNGYIPGTTDHNGVPYDTSNKTNNQQNNQKVGEAIIGGLILGAAINQALQPPRRPTYPTTPSRPQMNYYPPQPQYVPSRPQYVPSQPQYIESQPVERIISSRPVENVVTSEVIVSPKPNVVKATPKPNDSLKSMSSSMALADGSAADPLLAVSTQQSVEKMTATLGEYIEVNGTDAMKEAWKKVVDSDSSAEEVAKWWKDYGDCILDPEIKALGPIHVGMSKFIEDLKDGLISDAGKKVALDKIADMVADLPATHPLRDDLVADIGQMRQFQKLGELLGLASFTPDPLVPILQGTQAMCMPLPLVAEVIDMPLMQYPVADAQPLPSSVVIRIVNPSTNLQSVNCAIGSRQIEMSPGSAESLTSSTSVVFDPGNGTRRSVAVTAGTWAWNMENGVWSLSKVSPQITIDTSDFKSVFNYTVNGKQASLDAGQTVQHSNAMPIEIAFDRGNGSGVATKVLTFGTYTVGVDTSSRGLDLFRTDVPSVPPPSVTGQEVASTPAAKSTPGSDRVRKALENAEKQKELTALLRSLEPSKP